MKCVDTADFESRVNKSSEAAWDDPNMTIMIKCGAKRPIAAMILFELTNGMQGREHESADKGALKGDLSKEEYVRQKERIEWNGTKKAHEIALKCVQAGKWPVDYDEYANGANESFEDFLKRAIAAGHPAGYETWWDANCKKTYEEKHK